MDVVVFDKVSVTLDLEELIKKITSFSNADKVYLISQILDRFDANKESPLQALAKDMYNDCMKKGDDFKRLSEDKYWKKIGSAAESYGEVSKKYYKKAEIWKQFIDEKID